MLMSSLGGGGEIPNTPAPDPSLPVGIIICNPPGLTIFRELLFTKKFKKIRLPAKTNCLNAENLIKLFPVTVFPIKP